MAFFCYLLKMRFPVNPISRRDAFLHIAQISNERSDAMQFTNGGHQAFESLMKGRPGSDHFRAPTISVEHLPASSPRPGPPWCLMASTCIFRELAFSVGKIFSLCRMLSSVMARTASSSVMLRTIQGISAYPASSLTF